MDNLSLTGLKNIKKMIRKAVVDGQFYPDQAQGLKNIIEGFRPKGSLRISAKGIILPHAGFVYSGRVAVTTVSKVLAKKKLIILGPNHTGKGAQFSLWEKGAWKIADKEIGIDSETAAAILSKGNSISADTAAHIEEHSIEVELPILNYFFGDFKFVPIACQKANLTAYREAAEQIFKALKGLGEDFLLVASTDLTHYEPETTARKKDRRAIEAIINLDEKELLKRISEENITLCGEAPLAILISCLKKLGAKKSHVALYQTSGEVSGDNSSVVGYVGMIIQ